MRLGGAHLEREDCVGEARVWKQRKYLASHLSASDGLLFVVGMEWLGLYSSYLSGSSSRLHFWK